MLRKEIVRQLEFFRDIGVREIGANGVDVRHVEIENVGIVGIQESGAAMSPAPAKGGGPSPAAASAATRLAEIREELGDCQRCKLAPRRTNIVFGSGNPEAELVFVGEAPGGDEDREGLPFVGRAGQLLTRIIGSIIVDGVGLTREQVYICNVLKCRPPENRNPAPDEVQACNPFLKKQLAAIRPKIVCCLGTFAAQNLLQTGTPISRLRGRFHDVDGMRVIATFHPAYLLRSPERKRDVWDDMKQISAELIRLRE